MINGVKKGEMGLTSLSDWPFALADLRVYDRALTDVEIAAINNPQG